MEVRPARAAEWQMLRELRLRALADAPDAFSNTLEEAAALPEQVWRQWAQGGPASVDFIAWEGNVGVGMAAIFAVDDASGRMQLVAMWVDPRHRRQVLRDTLFDDAATLPVMTKPERARRADDQAQPNRPVTSVVSARSAHPGPRKPGLTLTGWSP